MTKSEFIKILAEEGIDNGAVIDELWNDRLVDNLEEIQVRQCVKKFKDKLPDFLVRKALHNAIEREFHTK